MAIKTKVPDIGADEVEITEILVKAGDKVETKRSLIAAEDDKASMGVPFPRAGIVKEVKVSIGDKTQTDALAMVFDSVDGTAGATPARAEGKKETAPVAAPAVVVVEDVNVPDIGSDEAKMTETLVRVSDKVKAEQSLITIGDDKAFMEVPAPLAGTMKEIKVNVGNKVSTGSLTMVFKVAGEAGAVTLAARQEVALAMAPAPITSAKEVSVPDTGSDEIEMTKVMMKTGNKVAAEQSLITTEGDKASMEVPVPFAGVVKKLKANVGDRVKTSSLTMIFEVKGAAPAVAPAEQEAAMSVPTAEAEVLATVPAAKAEGEPEFVEGDAYVHATPLIRRPTCESGANLAKVKSTGRKGRTLREDVQAYAKEAIKRAEAAPAATGGDIPSMLPWPKVDFSRLDEIKEMELGRIQKISGANLGRNWVMILHATRFDKADITELEAFRKQQNEEAAKRKLSVKTTLVVFIVEAVAAAFEQILRFNSSLSKDSRRLTLKKYINIDAMVDTPNGLVILVLKDVNKKGIIELSHEPMTISKKARDGKLTASEAQDSCFTISSVGGLGTTHSVPIVNTLKVAIPSVSKSAMEPVWNGKEFVLRLILSISFPSNCRVIDGVDDARLIIIINNTLSNIRRLVMQIKEPVQRPAFLW